MPRPLIREVAEYCWSNNFLKVFREYFTAHGYLFEDAPEILSGEHNLQYYALFQDYLKATLTKYLETLNVPIDEFYDEVRKTQEETSDPYLLTFIDCLLASTDYESFYKVMVKEGKKCKLARKLQSEGYASPLLSPSMTSADAKESIRLPSLAKDDDFDGDGHSQRSYKSEGKSESK